ncbi:MAG: SHOCT domain-containing protein [Arcobacteraceae bacterium]|nr:SHOCT domain-containing protein [Arcobacteraceae bacterium]
MRHLKNSIILLSISLFMSGCTQAPYPMGGGLHTVSATCLGFSAGPAVKTVYEEADKYAKEKNMVVVPESITAKDAVPFGPHPSAVLVFRLVSPDSPEAKSKHKMTTGLQKVQIIGNKPKKEESVEEKLSKLKNLYDSGSITEEEYKKARLGILSNF